MDTNAISLTVFFQEPFWIGVFERVESGRLSVCKVTFWFPPDPGLPGKTFAAATVWIDVETKAVIQVEVVED